MGILIDLLGALMIATLLLLMMITFQLQLRDTADRTIFASQMMSHQLRACSELNNLIALAGVRIRQVDTAVEVASDSLFVFYTYWDYVTNSMTDSVKTISLTREASPTAVGYELDITQGAPVENLDNIMWLEDLRFNYYDIDNNDLGSSVTGANRNNIFSLDVNMTFRRDPPTINTTPLRTKVQLRCYMMNRYLTYIP